MSEQVRRTHGLNELRVKLPPAVIFKALRFDENLVAMRRTCENEGKQENDSD